MTDRDDDVALALVDIYDYLLKVRWGRRHRGRAVAGSPRAVAPYLD